MADRYIIEILYTNGEEETITCPSLKRVVAELTSLATVTNIEDINTFDSHRLNEFGSFCWISEA